MLDSLDFSTNAPGGGETSSTSSKGWGLAASSSPSQQESIRGGRAIGDGELSHKLYRLLSWPDSPLPFGSGRSLVRLVAISLLITLPILAVHTWAGASYQMSASGCTTIIEVREGLFSKTYSSSLFCQQEDYNDRGDVEPSTKLMRYESTHVDQNCDSLTHLQCVYLGASQVMTFGTIIGSVFAIITCMAVLYVLYRQDERYIKHAVLTHTCLLIFTSIAALVVTFCFALFASSLSHDAESTLLTYSLRLPWYIMLIAAALSTINAGQYAYIVYNSYATSSTRGSGHIYDLDDCSTHSDLELVATTSTYAGSSSGTPTYETNEKGNSSASRDISSIWGDFVSQITSLFQRDDDHDVIDESSSRGNRVSNSSISNKHNTNKRSKSLSDSIHFGKSGRASLHDIESSWR